MTAVLATSGITVRFGGIVAVNEVDFVVPAGGIVGLVGPNGAGKTTLFEVISGFRTPHAGSVSLDGHDVTAHSPQYRAGHGLARTFQRLELFDELTVRQHVLLAHRFHGRRGLLRRVREDADERAYVDAILEVLGLAALGDEQAAALPLGAGRLVEVARALATRPRVILLDEPSSGLDEVETAKLVGSLTAMHDEHEIALVLVEHNLDLVLGLCDEVQVLDFGRTLARGTPDEVRRDTRVQAAYTGTADVGDVEIEERSRA